MARIRMAPERRKAQLLYCALKLAERHNYKNVTRLLVAANTNTTVGLINRYFGSAEGLREALLQQAVIDKNVAVVAQGIEDKHPLVKNAPIKLRQEARLLLDAIA